MNNPMLLAASLIDVDKIVGVNLGYAGQIEGDYTISNLARVFFKTISIMLYNQRELLNNPIFKGMSVREINIGAFNVETPDGFVLAQNLSLSARDTFEFIVRQVCGGEFDTEKFFGRWSDDQITRLQEGQRMEVERWGGSDSNLYFITDTKAPITLYHPDNPFWNYEKDGGRIFPKQPDENLERWLFGQMVNQMGFFTACRRAAGFKLLVG
jgi:hypothetical protein